MEKNDSLISIILILIITATLIGLFISSPLFSPPHEAFSCIAILGPDHTPKTIPDKFRIREEISLFVWVKNHYYETMYFRVVLKVFNCSSIPTEPEFPSPILYEYDFILMHNAEILIPFNVSVTSIEFIPNYWETPMGNYSGIEIKEMSINGVERNISICSVHGVFTHEFRLIFELWVYDEESDTFSIARNMETFSPIWGCVSFSVELTSSST